jgi:hypothetical protein
VANKILTVKEFKKVNYRILNSYFIKNQTKSKYISTAYLSFIFRLKNLKLLVKQFYCAVYFILTEPIIFTYQMQLRFQGGLKGGYQFERLVELRNIIKTYKPRSVLEFGSGASSLLFAKYCKLISLEEDSYWLDKYKYHLNKNFLIPQKLKLSLSKSLYFTPRVEKCFLGEAVATYESVLNWKLGIFDAVYIDGPTNWTQDQKLDCKVIDPKGSLPCIGVMELINKPKIIIVDGRRATIAFLIKSGAYDNYNLYLKGACEEFTKINPYHTIFVDKG